MKLECILRKLAYHTLEHKEAPRILSAVVKEK